MARGKQKGTVTGSRVRGSGSGERDQGASQMYLLSTATPTPCVLTCAKDNEWEPREKWKKCFWGGGAGLEADVPLELLTDTFRVDCPGCPPTAEV